MLGLAVVGAVVITAALIWLTLAVVYLPWISAEFNGYSFKGFLSVVPVWVATGLLWLAWWAIVGSHITIGFG